MKLIIHGGFFSEYNTNEETKKQKQEALKQVIFEGYQYLKRHTSIQTVVHVVSLLENNPLFNAGTGSQIQSDGIIRMSAALMDGCTLKMAGVVNIENVQNPIIVAEKLMSYDDKILSGSGATKFARQHNIPFYDPITYERKIEFQTMKKSNVINNDKKNTSTVGCVCLDGMENIAVATSTGGKGFETPGRVSDSATVAGNYANAYCGVSLTGIGEDIVSNALAAKIVTRVTDGMNLEEAFEKSFTELKQINGFAGAIAIDNKGNFYHKESTPKMVYASYDGDLMDLF